MRRELAAGLYALRGIEKMALEWASPGGNIVKSVEKSSDLISDYKPSPSPLVDWIIDWLADWLIS